MEEVYKTIQCGFGDIVLLPASCRPVAENDPSSDNKFYFKQRKYISSLSPPDLTRHVATLSYTGEGYVLWHSELYYTLQCPWN